MKKVLLTVVFALLCTFCASAEVYDIGDITIDLPATFTDVFCADSINDYHYEEYDTIRELMGRYDLVAMSPDTQLYIARDYGENIFLPDYAYETDENMLKHAHESAEYYDAEVKKVDFLQGKEVKFEKLLFFADEDGIALLVYKTQHRSMGCVFAFTITGDITMAQTHAFDEIIKTVEFSRFKRYSFEDGLGITVPNGFMVKTCADDELIALKSDEMTFGVFEPKENNDGTYAEIGVLELHELACSNVPSYEESSGADITPGILLHPDTKFMRFVYQFDDGTVQVLYVTVFGGYTYGARVEFLQTPTAEMLDTADRLACNMQFDMADEELLTEGEPYIIELNRIVPCIICIGAVMIVVGLCAAICALVIMRRNKNPPA